MTLKTIKISKDQLDQVFPFHFIVNEQMQVVQIGKVLTRLLPGLQLMDSFSDRFCIQSPKVPTTYESLLQQNETVFFLKATDMEHLVLRGQLLSHSYKNIGKYLLFVGSPVVRDLSGVIQLGLGLNDFAIHDSILDTLLVLQGKNNTIDDTKRMADQLKKEVIVRREAEKELKVINQNQEHMIEEATEELATANLELQTTVSQLREQNREMNLLNQMSDKLQSCDSVELAYDIIGDFLQQMYPGSIGMVSFNTSETLEYNRAIKWGSQITCDKYMTKRNCMVVNKASKSSDSHSTESISCPKSKYRHICQPISMQGSLIGIIHIGWNFHPENALLSEDHKSFLKVAGEHIGLAIHNLRLQQRLIFQSTRDALTGLYNRRYMEDSLLREKKRADRNHDDVGVIMIDVDFFKKFNDSHGHDAGDLVLQKLANFLELHIRGEDIACRYGGEEFFLILPSASLENTAARAETICREAEKSLFIEYQGEMLGPITLSLGIACYPHSGENFKTVLKAADDALYRAKRFGRNRIEVDDAHLLRANKIESVIIE